MDALSQNAERLRSSQQPRHNSGFKRWYGRMSGEESRDGFRTGNDNNDKEIGISVAVLVKEWTALLRAKKGCASGDDGKKKRRGKGTESGE